MAVLKNSGTGSLYAASLFSSLISGLALWSVMIIFTATKLSDETGSTFGALGPLKLFELTKTTLSGGGSSAGINFMGAGCLIYFGIFTFAGVILGFIRSRSLSKG